MQVIWTDPALERVEEIAVYIARDDRDAAARWTEQLFVAVGRLVDFPQSGRVVPELGARDIRELIFGHIACSTVSARLSRCCLSVMRVNRCAQKRWTGTDRTSTSRRTTLRVAAHVPHVGRH